MKKIVTLIVTLGLLIAYATPKVAGGQVANSLPITQAQLAGNFAITGQGVESLCFVPGFTATEPCSTAKAVTAQLNAVFTGQIFGDGKGNYVEL